MKLDAGYARPQLAQLPDGRRLGFRDIGDPDGIPILYCHGTPSSSVEARLFGSADEVLAAGARLIAPDRPGLGTSTFKRDRRIPDWPADVAWLADHLAIGRFGVLGYSGGSPYALACGAALPERVVAMGIVSGTAPFDVPGVTDAIAPDSLRFMRLATTRPLASRAMAWVMGLLARMAPERLIVQARSALPPPDAAVLSDPTMAKAFVAMVYEATHGSPGGAQHDTALMTGPWGFDPASVGGPVRLWHGTADRNAPPAMASYLASRLPQAELAMFPGEGHVSLGVKHRREILEAIVRDARAALRQGSPA